MNKSELKKLARLHRKYSREMSKLCSSTNEHKRFVSDVRPLCDIMGSDYLANARNNGTRQWPIELSIECEKVLFFSLHSRSEFSKEELEKIEGVKGNYGKFFEECDKVVEEVENKFNRIQEGL